MVVQVAGKVGGLVINNYKYVQWRLFLHTPQNVPNSCSQFFQKKTVVPTKLYSPDYKQMGEITTITSAQVCKQARISDASAYKNVFDYLPTDLPDDAGYHPKCFATLTTTPKDLPCSTAQHELAASVYRHVLRSNMKETVVNKSTTTLFAKKCIFC